MSWSGPKWMASNGHSGCIGRKWTTLSTRCHRTNSAQISIIEYHIWTTTHRHHPPPPRPHWNSRSNKIEARHRCRNCETRNRCVWARSHRIRWVSHCVSIVFAHLLLLPLAVDGRRISEENKHSSVCECIYLYFWWKLNSQCVNADEVETRKWINVFIWRTISQNAACCHF